MPTKTAQARWNGDLKSGKGNVKVGSGSFEGQYSFASRFEDGDGTNPEELIGAAHAGCYAMALSNELAGAGHDPQYVDAKAEVKLETTDEGPAITNIHLTAEAKIPGIDNDTFQEFANGAKEGCPVSKVLAGTEITLDAKLV